ncbi:unnamed protein product [Chrysodeixis includens]|uniref:Uncharacterized protein n=1 Tax=Chrysodeixis includens TaxID=689277 RepID=A0A9N8Q2P6_CHRIL|nr:unnamed protein product [Chrysodeixis includens]
MEPTWLVLQSGQHISPSTNFPVPASCSTRIARPPRSPTGLEGGTVEITLATGIDHLDVLRPGSISATSDQLHTVPASLAARPGGISATSTNSHCPRLLRYAVPTASFIPQGLKEQVSTLATWYRPTAYFSRAAYQPVNQLHTVPASCSTRCARPSFSTGLEGTGRVLATWYRPTWLVLQSEAAYQPRQPASHVPASCGTRCSTASFSTGLKEQSGSISATSTTSHVPASCSTPVHGRLVLHRVEGTGRITLDYMVQDPPVEAVLQSGQHISHVNQLHTVPASCSRGADRLVLHRVEGTGSTLATCGMTTWLVLESGSISATSTSFTLSRLTAARGMTASFSTGLKERSPNTLSHMV